MAISKTQKSKEPVKSKESTPLSSIIGGSSRLTLTYIVFTIWVALAIFAMIVDADLYSLAVYFASGLPLILGYMWAETSRPTLTDASDIIKNIGQSSNRRRNFGGGGEFGAGNFGGFGNGGFGNGGFGNGNGSFGNGGNFGANVPDVNVNVVQSNDQSPDQLENDIISIYSDDATVELKVNQNQLVTLSNIGYINMIEDKYTFKKSLLDQIKSLVNDNLQPPPNI